MAARTRAATAAFGLSLATGLASACGLDREGAPAADAAVSGAASSASGGGSSTSAAGGAAGAGGVGGDGAVCGDGMHEAPEGCDDGNLRNGDGCSSACVVEPPPICGDGTKDAGEECDDGNDVTGDGCDECVVDCGSAQFKDPSTGHCYQHFDDQISWSDAESACEGWGGTLASLTSAGELALVAPQLGGGETWLGGTDDPAHGAMEGAWIWITGEPFTAMPQMPPWHPAEPGGMTNENCMEIRGDALFNDLGCGADRTYLCER